MNFKIRDGEIKNLPVIFKKGTDRYKMTDVIFDTKNRVPRCINFDNVQDEITKMSYVVRSTDQILINFYMRSIIQETIFKNDLNRVSKDEYSVSIIEQDDSLYKYLGIITKNGELFDEVSFNMVTFLKRS